MQNKNFKKICVWQGIPINEKRNYNKYVISEKYKKCKGCLGGRDCENFTDINEIYKRK